MQIYSKSPMDSSSGRDPRLVCRQFTVGTRHVHFCLWFKLSLFHENYLYFVVSVSWCVRYASLYFIVGLLDEPDVNELAILELIHCLVETLDKFFENVCELDIMFHLEKAHFIIGEMIMDGCIVETNKANIMAPIQMLEKAP